MYTWLTILMSKIHIENFYSKILYSFIQTYFLTNDNPYGRSLLFRRHTFTFLNLTHAKGFK